MPLANPPVATCPRSGRPLHVYGPGPLSLICFRCRACGALGIAGFWHQLGPKVVDAARKRVTVLFTCPDCGVTRPKVFRLTTGRACRHRLTGGWDRLFWRVAPYLPHRWWRPLGRLALYLELRCPL